MDILTGFASLVFNDDIMRERLPSETYQVFRSCVDQKRSLDINTANVIASAMKDWAIEHGATHYTHWFQPMTGYTAEKHDSFISPDKEGKAIMEFSGKQLIKGEPDASSFPSGGLRATFEARGYTNWDPTSYAFIKENTLCVPTAFCSYSGEALDKKTPLLRSMEAIHDAVVEIMEILGVKCDSVETTIGPEQEYFLVDRAAFKKRRDLIFTGRTLFGAAPPKGQELGDHYFGAIRPRVLQFMRALDDELWKLGVFAKTEHNEGAPSQHELAPVFTTANVAVDHNQMIMEMMKKIAAKFDLACLLHEKPYKGVNGSGKHVNWSVGINNNGSLFKAGDNPRENTVFLLFSCAVIAAVDENQDLLRISCAGAGNDHRLGGHEAPPAIISIYIGNDLENIYEALAGNADYVKYKREQMETGVHVLPQFKKDTADRNRTSPFAFTGNKFEFRMPGSSFSVSDAGTVLNAIMADKLREYSLKLRGIPHGEKMKEAVEKLIGEEYNKHRRIVFNGNNYSEEWVKTAEERGLLNLPSTADALPYLVSEKNIALYQRQGIFSENELHSHLEIYYENYCKTVSIEAATMISMAKREIIPAIEKYIEELCRTGKAKKELSDDICCAYEKKIVNRLASDVQDADRFLDELEVSLADAKDLMASDAYGAVRAFRDNVIPLMEKLRSVCDDAETVVSKEYWPFPTYGELLFSF